MIGLGRATYLVLLVGYGAALAVLTGLNQVGAERWWFGALNLYLPQVLWAVPALALLAAAPLAGRRWVWAPALYLVWVLGPVMGFHWSAWKAPGPEAGPQIRALTCNAKFGDHDTGALLKDIERYRPQVVLLQDADGLMESPFARFFRDWNVRSFGQYVIASRLPLSKAEVHWYPSAAGKTAFLRCQARLGDTPVTLYVVHFQTPRESLNAFRSVTGDGQFPDAIQELRRNAAIRLEQARTVRDMVAPEPGPVILAGDLNSPEPSLVCLTLKQAGLQDAFSAAGRGYGYTYGQFLLAHRIPWLHHSWMRLDHIMASSGLRVWRCWVGTGEASDHRPVIADLTLG